MVHPYLRRRSGEERVDYPSPELEVVLGKTLGVKTGTIGQFRDKLISVPISATDWAPGGFDGADAVRLGIFM